MSEEHLSPQTIDDLTTAMRQGFEKIEQRRKLETWTPVIVVVIAAGLGLVGYFVERSLDRKNDLQRLKQTAYVDYLEAFQLVVAADETDEVADANLKFHVAIENMILIASDDVLRVVGNLNKTLFETSGRRTDRDMKKISGLMANMYRAMRRDVFDELGLSDNELNDLFWGRIES